MDKRKLAALFSMFACAILLFGCISGGNPKPATPAPTPTPAPSVTPITECSADSDCVVAGCVNQWCVPQNREGELPCRWNTWHVCIALTTCGCSEGVCDWKANPAFLECKENPQRFPFYSPPNASFISECNSRGGEVTALPNAENCTVQPSCSSDLRCSLDPDCPSGFDCQSGKCAKSALFCGGTGATGCGEGYRCAQTGTYYAATGMCLEVCNSTEDCEEGSTCIGDLCTRPPDAECSVDEDCDSGLRCNAGKCLTVDGVACGAPGDRDCPQGFYCKTGTFCREGDTCTQIPGTCDATFIPENLSRLCGRPAGEINYSNVTGIAACASSPYFRIFRSAGDKPAYADSNGTIFRECGSSAPPWDPHCGKLESDCHARSVSSCPNLEETRFIHCMPPYSGNPDCPEISDPVCAQLSVGSIPALRHTEWAEFGNGCLACNANTPTQIAEGYWRGKCS
ncbi:Uncharacterised protein [uncultured archaeon]|nr:Uncharacterised protein [uncultured archaeon]